MQNNRVWQRACGLTRTVVEGVHVDDNANIVSVRPDARHGAVADGAAVDHLDRVRVPPSPTPHRLALVALRSPTHNSHAEPDPRIEQESDITAATSRGHCNTSASFCDGAFHRRVCRGRLLRE